MASALRVHGISAPPSNSRNLPGELSMGVSRALLCSDHMHAHTHIHIYTHTHFRHMPTSSSAMPTYSPPRSVLSSASPRDAPHRRRNATSTTHTRHTSRPRARRHTHTSHTSTLIFTLPLSTRQGRECDGATQAAGTPPTVQWCAPDQPRCHAGRAPCGGRRQGERRTACTEPLSAPH